MAIIKAGILSKVSGKVAGVVGSNWKGVNYLRELVKPANPNTPLQQAQRGKMQSCVACARNFVGDIFKPYLDKFLKDMSGYNWFVKNNIKKFTGEGNALTVALDMTFGNMGTGSMTSTQSHAAGGVQVGATIPVVAAGHTCKAVAFAYNVTKGTGMVADKDNPEAEQEILSFGDFTGAAAGDKVAVGLFFVDIDANGVVQAISTNNKDFITLT